jgi:alkylation response protein AidB-like acyl-CoA dehydrogenase
MANGNMIATACITEAHCGSDIRNIETTATVSDTDPNTYTLNGKKMWVTNGQNANVFLVYCKTKERYTSDDYDDRFSFFLVDRDTPGVTISPPISTLGLRGLGLTHVEFKDVKVNVVHHLIGQLGEGLNVLRNLHGYVRTTLAG